MTTGLHYDSNIVRLRGSADDHVLRYLTNRQIGCRSKRSPFTAECSLNGLKYTTEVNREGKPEWIGLLKYQLFSKGGLLGLSNRSSWLVGMNILSREMKALLMFFRLTPKEALLTHSIIVDDLPSVPALNTYFPPNEERFSASIVMDGADIMSAKRDASISTTLAMHMLLPQQDLHIIVNTTVMVVARIIDGITLRKCYGHVFNNGMIINTGVSLLVISVDDKLLPFIKGRRIWSIRRGASDVAGTKQRVDTDLGEWFSVQSPVRLAPNLSQRRTDVIGNVKQFHMVEIEADSRELGVHSQTFLTRDSVSVELISHSLLGKQLNTIAYFKNAVLQGITDYESDVINVQGNVVTVMVLALGEIQRPMPDNTSRNEFFIFQMEFLWDLQKGKAYASQRSAICRGRLGTQDAFRNTWFPMKAMPSKGLPHAFSISNANMYKDVRPDRLTSSGGALELLCDEDSWEMQYVASASLEMLLSSEDESD